MQKAVKAFRVKITTSRRSISIPYLQKIQTEASKKSEFREAPLIYLYLWREYDKKC